MKIFRDIINNDEVLSDVFPMELIADGTVYKVKCKLVKESFTVNEASLGGNASAEGEDAGEGGDGSVCTQGVNVVLNHKLSELELSKKDFKTTIAKYMKEIKEKLKENNPDELDCFQKGVATFVKDVIANYKDYQTWFGESSSMRGFDTMPCLMSWDEDDTPWMYFFKHGLLEEKC